MGLSELQITNLRNIQSARLRPGAGVNLIYGNNGSGKTTLLEAISLLGLARSFRSTRHHPLIRHGESEFTVYGKLLGEESGRLGVSKHRNGITRLRYNDAPAKSAAELAVHLPVLSLTANTFDLVAGPPKTRRSLLDWLAFHVEPGFIDDWRRLQNALKQRNSLLRRGKIGALELQPWDRQLAVLTEKIDPVRERAKKLLEDTLASFEPLYPELGVVKLSYQRGWSKDQDYSETLEAHRQQDFQRGHTSVGPHRADVRIEVAGASAAETLSRGQQKLLITALVLSQGKAYFGQTNRHCTYLIDDLSSEFDEAHRGVVARWLSGLKGQIFITGIEAGPLMSMWEGGAEPATIKRFHVKRGEVQMLSP